MGKVIVYNALNRDYTDRICKEVLKPGSTLDIPNYAAEKYPIQLLSTYRLFNNNYRFVSICMFSESVTYHMDIGTYESNKISVIKELSNFDLVHEDIELGKIRKACIPRVKLSDKNHTLERIIIPKKDIENIKRASCDYSSIISYRDAGIIYVTGNNCTANISGPSTYLFIGGDEGRVCSNGGSTRITSMGIGNFISVSGPESTICSGGDNTEISASGDRSTIGTLGDNTKVSVTGDRTEIYCGGNNTKVSSTGKKAVIKCTGKNCTINAAEDSVVSASLGSWITLTKTEIDNDGNKKSIVKSWEVDGECIFPDVFYKFDDFDFEPIKEVDIRKYLNYVN